MSDKLGSILQFCAVLTAVSLPAFAGAAPAPTPEPATFLLIGGGLAVVLGLRQYRSRKR